MNKKINKIKYYTAGLVLLGKEVKIMKSDNLEINKSFFYIKNKELYINFNNFKLKRYIKLLLKKKEIKEIINYNKIYKLMAEKLLIKNNLIKLKIIVYL